MTTPTRILIVDDDPIARQLYADCLADTGHAVLLARDAKEASQTLEHEPVDVVVTDLVLPGQDGLAVLAEAKRRDPGIEVIVITAVDRVDPAVRAIKSGAADYLVKPVTPESLELSVSRCLATRQLLKENALLRQHLALVETGQRLATTLDRDRLFPLAVRAFADVLGAQAALLFARRSDGRFALFAREGITNDDVEPLVNEALGSLGQVSATGGELPLGGRPFRVLFAEANGETYGVCLLREPTAAPVAWTNAAFLASHFALALQNLNRLSAAEDLAYLDDLTKLHNLRYLHAVLDREITNSKQTGEPFSVLFIDLDRFKTVNDTYGHLVGSRLLVEVGGLIRGCVRDIDVAVRYGGDEYVIVLLGTDAGGALKVGERIRRTIEAHRFQAKEGLGLALTICVGVASYPEHASEKQHILDCADRAMYRGKQGSRNVIYVASPSDPMSRTA